MRGYCCEYSYEVGELHDAVSLRGKSEIGLIILQVTLLLIPFFRVVSRKLPRQTMLLVPLYRSTDDKLTQDGHCE